VCERERERERKKEREKEGERERKREREKEGERWDLSEFGVFSERLLLVGIELFGGVLRQNVELVLVLNLHLIHRRLELLDLVRAPGFRFCITESV
jgi:hypothetical protein